MFELLPSAKRDAEIDPSKRVADFLVDHLSRNGIVVTIDEAIAFIRSQSGQTLQQQLPVAAPIPININNPQITQPINNHAGIRLHLTAINADAYGYRHHDGFLVVQGSRAVNQIQPSLSQTNRRLREELLSRRIFTLDGESILLTQDYKFNSGSQAASIFTGRSANGNLEWE
jgi:hypothetical protein